MDGKSRRGRPCREWLDDIIEWGWTTWTRPVPPRTRPTGMEESDPVNGWPQRAISLWEMMMMMMNVSRRQL